VREIFLGQVLEGDHEVMEVNKCFKNKITQNKQSNHIVRISTRRVRSTCLQLESDSAEIEVRALRGKKPGRLEITSQKNPKQLVNHSLYSTILFMNIAMCLAMTLAIRTSFLENVPASLEELDDDAAAEADDRLCRNSITASKSSPSAIGTQR